MHGTIRIGDLVKVKSFVSEYRGVIGLVVKREPDYVSGWPEDNLKHCEIQFIDKERGVTIVRRYMPWDVEVISAV